MLTKESMDIKDFYIFHELIEQVGVDSWSWLDFIGSFVFVIDLLLFEWFCIDLYGSVSNVRESIFFG